MSLADGRSCTLVTASCTTGWSDWIHGELWLCPDGLRRRSLGLVATVRHGLGPTLDLQRRPARRFETREIEQITAGRRNRWIPWTQVTRATLTRDVMNDSLHLELADRRREKFLWLAIDGGFDLLRTELGRVLPGGLEVVE